MVFPIVFNLSNLNGSNDFTINKINSGDDFSSTFGLSSLDGNLLSNIVPLAYSDRFSTTAGENHPHPRLISHSFSPQSEPIAELQARTNRTTFLGQSVDHDLSFTTKLSEQEAIAQNQLIHIPLPSEKSFQREISEWRSLDGTGNNLENPEYGSAGSSLLNIVPLAYSDRFSKPAGENRPNPRVISNTLSQQNEFIPDPQGLTNLTAFFGQFVDHDLSLTPELSEEEAIAQNRYISIPVPSGDPYLDPQGTGQVEIELRDSVFIEGTGTGVNNPRQLPNQITAWLDLSSVYGSDEERSSFLRSFEGGKLKTSDGNLLPFNDGTIKHNDNPTNQDPHELFVAGDVRANENSALISMQTLFMREHNYIATQLVQFHPDWTDEQIFQRAREINTAQYNAIIYQEYLPSLLGDQAIAEYSGYDSNINPNISRTFSMAGFRLGHTQLSSEILRLEPSGQEIAAGSLTLAEVFFKPGSVIQESGIDPIVRGIASSVSQKIDNKLIDDVRNLLFGFGPNASARDLSAINIQRGRANGLADYNTVRESFGLARVNSFAEITSDEEKQTQLEELYGNVDDIDLFVGMLAEDLLPSASVGETVSAIVSDQFRRLRDGDRFYYENQFSPEEVELINKTTFSDIIRRNTDTTIIQDNAFTLLNRGTKQNDFLNGGLGNDTLKGDQGADILKGEYGNDFLYGGQGRDRAHGGLGDDRIFGNRGNDFLSGNQGDDFLYGGQGRDHAYGGSGDDRIFGNRGNDHLYGGSGNDYVHGGLGNDRIFGNRGNDLLYGNQGDDLLNGGQGRDILYGDRQDTLTGGKDRDIFVLDICSKGDILNDHSFITDFTSGQDLIQLSGDLGDYIVRNINNFSLIANIEKGTFDLIAVVNNGGTALNVESDLIFV